MIEFNLPPSSRTATPSDPHRNPDRAMSCIAKHRGRLAITRPRAGAAACGGAARAWEPGASARTAEPPS